MSINKLNAKCDGCSSRGEFICINSKNCIETKMDKKEQELLNPVEVFKELIANKDDRVLIADDELAMIETVQDILDYCGYTMYVKKKD